MLLRPWLTKRPYIPPVSQSWDSFVLWWEPQQWDSPCGDILTLLMVSPDFHYIAHSYYIAHSHSAAMSKIRREDKQNGGHHNIMCNVLRIKLL